MRTRVGAHLRRSGAYEQQSCSHAKHLRRHEPWRCTTLHRHLHHLCGLCSVEKRTRVRRSFWRLASAWASLGASARTRCCCIGVRVGEVGRVPLTTVHVCTRAQTQASPRVQLLERLAMVVPRTQAAADNSSRGS